MISHDPLDSLRVPHGAPSGYTLVKALSCSNRKFVRFAPSVAPPGCRRGFRGTWGQGECGGTRCLWVRQTAGASLAGRGRNCRGRASTILSPCQRPRPDCSYAHLSTRQRHIWPPAAAPPRSRVPEIRRARRSNRPAGQRRGPTPLTRKSRQKPTPLTTKSWPNKSGDRTKALIAIKTGESPAAAAVISRPTTAPRVASAGGDEPHPVGINRLLRTDDGADPGHGRDACHQCRKAALSCEYGDHSEINAAATTCG
jgi:hypothetical protein